MEKLTNEKKIFYISGDFNINMNKSNSSLQAMNFVNAVESNGAIHLISKPT